MPVKHKVSESQLFLEGIDEMEASDYYKDSYQRTFLDDYDFLHFLRDREENACWLRSKSNEIRVAALEKHTYETDSIISEYANMGKKGVIEDTLRNTSLYVTVNDIDYPVRSCAVKTILERARISGNALQKVKKPVLAQILNYCLHVAKGDALLRVLEDKVSAVHGGDNMEYAILEAPELFLRIKEYLDSHFPGNTFAGASYDHSLMSASWELTGQDDMVKAYKDALKHNDIYIDDIQPALRFSTSDVGVCGANLYPSLVAGNDQRIITLGSPLRLEHKAGASLDKFQEQLGFIYSLYTQAVKQLADLLSIEIINPINCLIGVMKRIGIPKKLAFSAIDLFKAQSGDDPCTAHDLYYGICEVIFMKQCEGASGSQLAKVEEDVARALSIRWHNYDLPGEIKW